MHVHHVHHSPRARVTVLSLQTSVSLTRNMNVKNSQRAVLYIFRNIDTGTFSLTPSITGCGPHNFRDFFRNLGLVKHIQAQLPSFFCEVVLGVLSSLAIILLRKRELVALLCVVTVFLVSSSRCHGLVQSVIVTFPGHTHFFSFQVHASYLSLGCGQFGPRGLIGRIYI